MADAGTKAAENSSTGSMMNIPDSPLNSRLDIDANFPGRSTFFGKIYKFSLFTCPFPKFYSGFKYFNALFVDQTKPNQQENHDP
jgi:hypothetical protein